MFDDTKVTKNGNLKRIIEIFRLKVEIVKMLIISLVKHILYLRIRVHAYNSSEMMTGGIGPSAV